MIKRTNIQNFKGLSEFEVDDLARVTLIGGCNNIGKTIFLEALFLCFDRDNPQAIIRQYAWRNVMMVSINPDALWAPIFSMYDTEKAIQIRLWDEQNKLENLTLKYNRNFNYWITPDQTDLQGAPTQIDTRASPGSNVCLDVIYQFEQDKPQTVHHIIGQQGISVDREGATPLPGKAYFISATGRSSPQVDAVHFGQLDILGKQQEIVDFLRETVEPRLESLSTVAVGQQSLIHAKLKGYTRKIPVAYMGDGTARLLSNILILATHPNQPIFIDEIDIGIHYSALPKVWLGIVKAAKQYNCQVFATTHSYECLQAVQGLPSELHDQFCYVRLEQNGPRTVGKTYAFDVLGAALERGWEVR